MESTSLRPRRILNERFLGQLDQRCVLQGLDPFGRRFVRPVNYLIGAFERLEVESRSRHLCLKPIQIKVDVSMAFS